MWDFKIQILFESKNLHEIVDRTEGMPTGSITQDTGKKWKLRDAQTKNYILRTVDRNVKIHFIACT